MRKRVLLIAAIAVGALSLTTAPASASHDYSKFKTVSSGACVWTLQHGNQHYSGGQDMAWASTHAGSGCADRWVGVEFTGSLFGNLYNSGYAVNNPGVGRDYFGSIVSSMHDSSAFCRRMDPWTAEPYGC